MDISKLYTKTMHKALQNALRKGFRIDYSPAGGFISHIRNNKQGVIFSFNTRIGSAACMTAESFVSYDYNKVLDDLQGAYPNEKEEILEQLGSVITSIFNKLSNEKVFTK